MKEPTFNSGAVPYSAAPVRWLREAVEQVYGWTPNPVEQEHYDADFRRRYAAILLRERGL